MLTRKCGKRICDLLVLGDCNVTITVIQKRTSRFTQKSYIDLTWRQIFAMRIGSDIVNDATNTYLVSCQTELAIDEFSTSGNQIIDQLWEYIKDIDVVRLEITQSPIGINTTKTWIIARE